MAIPYCMISEEHLNNLERQLTISQEKSNVLEKELNRVKDELYEATQVILELKVSQKNHIEDRKEFSEEYHDLIRQHAGEIEQLKEEHQMDLANKDEEIACVESEVVDAETRLQGAIRHIS